MAINAQSKLAFIPNIEERYSNISTYHDEKYAAMWCYMHAQPRPCFTPALLSELNHSLEKVKAINQKPGERKIKYHIMASQIRDIFNVGGDLDYFTDCIVSRNRERLLAYALSCIQAIYMAVNHFESDVTSIALVQGDALGGGFEAALACDVLIAERNTKMGFPEVLFNLFPGMGAYSLLARKLSPKQAKEMMTNGKLYSAEELHEIGLVDILADEYQGDMAVYDYIKKADRSSNALQAMRAVEKFYNPISMAELEGITELWVDAAMKLDIRDLKMMSRLINRQSKYHAR